MKCKHKQTLMIKKDLKKHSEKTDNDQKQLENLYLKKKSNKKRHKTTT